MSKSSRQSTPSVSLFPFLAVLVCAMGALIFLLLITTRQIREKRAEVVQSQQIAEAPAQVPATRGPDPVLIPLPMPEEPEAPEPEVVAEPPIVIVQQTPTTPLPSRPPLPKTNPGLGQSLVKTPIPQPKPQAPLPDPNEPIRAQLAQYRAHLEKGLAALTEQEKLAETGKARIQETTSKLATLQGQIQNAEALALEQSAHAQELQKQLQDLQKEKPQLLSRIEQLQQDRKQASSRYQVVPYDGLTGTTRKPIYVECRHDGIRFLAEDVTITPQDLAGFIPDYNPILAGAEALVKYYDAENARRSEFAQEPPPYVLLIVRPKGSIAFYKARRSLEALSRPYGYELVDDSVELAIPTADPEAKKACQEAIAQMLAEKARMQQSATAQRNDPTATGYRLKRGSNGLFELKEEGSDGQLGTQMPKSEWDQVDEVPALFEKPARPLASSKNRLGQRPENGPSEMPLPSRPVRTGPSAQPFPDELAQNGPPGSDPGSPLTEIPRPLVQNAFDPLDNPGSRPNRFQPPGNEPRRLNVPGSQPETEFDPGSENQPGVNPGVAPQKMGTQTQPGTAPSSLPKNFSKPDQSNSAGDPNPSSSQPGGPNAYAPPGQTLPSQLDFGNSNPQPENAPKRVWGVPHARDGIGLEREVKVQVIADRVWINGEREVLVNSPEEDGNFAERFGIAVDEYARTWGGPPKGFYWVPAVRFEVVPLGTTHYEYLSKEIKSRWGLPSKMKSVADPSGFSRKEGTRP